MFFFVGCYKSLLLVTLSIVSRYSFTASLLGAFFFN